MQHQFWITKQTLSKKFGRKEDQCIVSSDAELDAKLELFHNIKVSCSITQKVIDKFKESVCYLSQETNSLGRFLKDNSERDKTDAGKAMLSIGKSFIFCAQEHLVLHEPIMRFYQELETFHQQAIGDTWQNILSMERARIEYRATLSWMKNISQQLDPDTTKKLDKFKKVQDQVRRGKLNFDKSAFDCLQKVDLLAAARCNMFNQTLSFYQNKIIDYSKKSLKIFSMVLTSLEREDVLVDKIPIKSLVSYQIESFNTQKAKIHNHITTTTPAMLMLILEQEVTFGLTDEHRDEIIESTRAINNGLNFTRHAQFH